MKNTRRFGWGLLIGGLGMLFFSTGLMLALGGFLLAAMFFKQATSIGAGVLAGIVLMLILKPTLIVLIVAAAIIMVVISLTIVFMGSEASSPTSRY